MEEKEAWGTIYDDGGTGREGALRDDRMHGSYLRWGTGPVVGFVTLLLTTNINVTWAERARASKLARDWGFAGCDILSLFVYDNISYEDLSYLSRAVEQVCWRSPLSVSLDYRGDEVYRERFAQKDGGLRMPLLVFATGPVRGRELEKGTQRRLMEVRQVARAAGVVSAAVSLSRAGYPSALRTQSRFAVPSQWPLGAEIKALGPLVDLAALPGVTPLPLDAAGA